MFRKPLLALAVLGTLFFSDLVVHPDQTLYSPYSDLIPLHLPARRFLARSWQETGEIPLWCPYNLGGMPFVHDVQSSAFYPLHWPLLWLSEDRQGAALSWLIVIHVIIAGWCMYGYARFRGIRNFGAFVAGLGYMFAGKWLLHLLAGGHYNMAPLAWLPLVLLFLERGIGQRSLWNATAAGVIYALMILAAYPYVTLYAGLFIACWTLGTCFKHATESERTCVVLGRWLGYGAWTATVAVALGAIQLLPSLEASRYASRSLGVPASADTFTGGLWSLVGLLGPPITQNPDWLWENRTALGLIWVFLAVQGMRLAGKKDRWPTIACAIVLIFACGGAAICQRLPGFRLFQLPSRALLLLAFPVSLLAGMAIDRLREPQAIALCANHRKNLLKLAGGALSLLLFLAVVLQHRGERLVFHPYWIVLAITLPSVYFLLDVRRLPASCWVVGWTAVLLTDLWPIPLSYVAVRSEADIFQPSACARFVAERREQHGRVLEIAPPGASANDTPLWPGLPVALGVEAVRGFNPVDVLRYKQYLQFLTGQKRELRPLDRMFTSAVLGGFPIREQRLADLLGIRYLTQPRNLPLDRTVPDAQARKQWRPVYVDAAPRSFNFIPASSTGADCGMHTLPPYTVYDNEAALPRAFVVSNAQPLRDDTHALDALRAIDISRTVLIEGISQETISSKAGHAYEPATITTYEPNRVTVHSHGSAGYLVLTDVWFPGWRCTVDGQEVPVYRADYLFRAVRVAAGDHVIAFRFEPLSCRLGKWISLVSAGLVFLWMAAYAGYWLAARHQGRLKGRRGQRHVVAAVYDTTLN